MDKRTFLKNSAIIGLGAIVAPSIVKSELLAPAAFELPKLQYATDALEPYIDKQTMELHHGKHHAAYVNKLNEALAGKPEANVALPELIKNIGTQPMAVRNNGGGHYNHSLFWTLLTNAKLSAEKNAPELSKAIIAKFGSLDSFKEQFTKAALGQFGSGWAWLSFDKTKGELFISGTPNQDSPLMKLDGIRHGQPIIGLDVWEHAYYLKYQNKRADYVSAFWSVLNWEQANKYWLEATR